MKHKQRARSVPTCSAAFRPAPTLASLQRHHDELVELLSRLLWEVVRRRRRRPSDSERLP